MKDLKNQLFYFSTIFIFYEIKIFNTELRFCLSRCKCLVLLANINHLLVIIYFYSYPPVTEKNLDVERTITDLLWSYRHS